MTKTTLFQHNSTSGYYSNISRNSTTKMISNISLTRRVLTRIGVVPTIVRNYCNSNALNARILATDGIDDCCVQIFKERGHTVDLLKTLPEADLIKVIGEYDGLVVRSATKVTPSVLKHGRKLKIVGRAGVGVDNINVKEATKNGIMVMNTPGGNTVSTAQLTLSLLLSLARNVPAADLSIKANKWDRKSFTGVELAGKTLGIVGFGRIGQTVAQSALSMGMNVVAYDPVLHAEAFAEANVKKADLEEIWKKSDFITFHTPLTPETSNLFDDKVIAKCKKGVRVINCARGGIVDEAALLRGLQSGHIAGAALDVFTHEPPKEHLKDLLTHPNLICTPHLGASTEEAQINVARDIANQMCDVFDQKEFLGVVNVDYLSASTQSHMKPFMTLAETIGAMQAQLGKSPVKSVTLKTYGGRDVNITTKKARRLLEAMVLKGIVKFTKSGLNPDLISSPTMASDIGIQSIISDEEPDHLGSPYWNLLSVEVQREDGTQTLVTGAVFGSVPHIVKVDQYNDLFAFKPEGNYILSFKNEDRPGAISEVLEVLHMDKVNIASMNVARPAVHDAAAPEGSKALCFMALDDDITTKAMETLQSLPFLHNVSKIQLR